MRTRYGTGYEIYTIRDSNGIIKALIDSILCGHIFVTRGNNFVEKYQGWLIELRIWEQLKRGSLTSLKIHELDTEESFQTDVDVAKDKFRGVVQLDKPMVLFEKKYFEEI